MMNDYSKWTPNIRVRVWGSAPVVDDVQNCPEPDRHFCADMSSDCPHFMGYDSSRVTFPYNGGYLSACCGKLLDV